jgi:hypothetical protein
VLGSKKLQVAPSVRRCLDHSLFEVLKGTFYGSCPSKIIFLLHSIQWGCYLSIILYI